MQKLYCYVDETGQDTQGALFLVALVVINKERDDVRRLLMRVEDDSKKGKLKWKKATRKQKSAYIGAVLNAAALHGKLFYGQFSNTTSYLPCIIDSIARGALQRAPKSYKVSIFIDGLGRDERRIVAVQLRRRGIHLEKVRGLRDEADEFIRLADALAGFVRDYLEGGELCSCPLRACHIPSAHYEALKRKTPMTLMG
jgi:hypothetical protein